MHYSQRRRKTQGGRKKKAIGGKYTVFFSTGICPKKREEMEKKRDEAAGRIRSRSRRKKNKLTPAPMRRAKPRQSREHQTTQANQEQTKYSTAGRRHADYEHAGVAIAVHRKWKHLIEEVRETSGRNMTLILGTEGGGTSLTVTYAPTADKPDKVKDNYWDELAREMELSRKHIRIVAGDFNARMYETQPDDAPHIGTNIVHREGYLTAGIAEGTRDNRDRFVEFLKTQGMVAANTII